MLREWISSFLQRVFGWLRARRGTPPRGIEEESDSAPLAWLEALAGEDRLECAKVLVQISALATAAMRELKEQVTEEERRRIEQLAEGTRMLALEAGLDLQEWTNIVMDAAEELRSSDRFEVAGRLIVADLFATGFRDSEFAAEEATRAANELTTWGTLARCAVELVGADRLPDLVLLRQRLLRWGPLRTYGCFVRFLWVMADIDAAEDPLEAGVNSIEQRLRKRREEHEGRPLPPFVTVGQA